MLNKLLQNRLDKKSKPYYNLNKLFALQAKKQTEQAINGRALRQQNSHICGTNNIRRCVLF